MQTPTITVINDYDGVFENRVKAAIELAAKSESEIIYKEITIDSGPYRSYCFGYAAKEETINLDFYSAARVFGFEHSIEDIANVLIGKTE